jgi:hypothetical protein
LKTLQRNRAQGEGPEFKLPYLKNNNNNNNNNSKGKKRRYKSEIEISK